MQSQNNVNFRSRYATSIYTMDLISELFLPAPNLN